MGQGLKFGFGDKTNCQCVSGPDEAPRMQSVVQRLRAEDAHGGELPRAGLAHGGDSVHQCVSCPDGVDALHQLKNVIFRGRSWIPWSWSCALPDTGFCKNRT